MAVSPLVRTPLARALAAGAAAGLLLTGCGAGSARPIAAHPAAATTAAPASATGDLAAGLLPQSAFGPGAQVHSASPQELQQALAMAGSLSAASAGGQVSPPECGQALQGLAGGLGSWRDAVAEGAMTGGLVTGEVLARGGDAAALVQQVDAVRSACSDAKASMPGRGSATVSAAALALDDARHRFPAVALTGAALTVDATATDGTSRTIPVFVAAVRDGDRVMALVQGAPQGAAPDQVAFEDLLARAIQQQTTLD